MKEFSYLPALERIDELIDGIMARMLEPELRRKEIKSLQCQLRGLHEQRDALVAMSKPKVVVNSHAEGNMKAVTIKVSLTHPKDCRGRFSFKVKADNGIEERVVERSGLKWFQFPDMVKSIVKDMACWGLGIK